MQPLIQNDAVLLALLTGVLALVFYAESHPKTSKIFQFLPSLLLMYFLPSLLNIEYFKGSEWEFRIINAEESNLYFVASRYLLPASLLLLTLNIDFQAIQKLGIKAIILFLTGTLGIIIGGPIAFMIMQVLMPDVVSGETWRGLTTIAGSWIGGGANQTAMKEIFEVENEVFSAMVAVDIIVANIWLGFLLYGANISEKVDKWLRADGSSIEEIKKRLSDYQAKIAKIPQLKDWVFLIGLAFGGVGIAHFVADLIVPFLELQKDFLTKYGLTSLTSHFFWLVVIATTLGLALSFTPFRKMEGIGASKMGSLFIYILVTTIGMQMDILAIFSQIGLFLLGITWMLVHITLLLLVGRLLKAPLFFIAIGSQANVGGAASAPVVASAFHPSLAPIGALLAVLGYAVGTYGALFCGYILDFLH